MSIQRTVQQMRSEFDTLPGLCLSVPEAVERWGIDSVDLEVILDTMVDVRLLERSHDGTYARRRSTVVTREMGRSSARTNSRHEGRRAC